MACRREIDKRLYDVLLRGGATTMKQLLASIGDLEMLFAQRDLSKPPKLLAPLNGLSPLWIDAADDGCVELRLAAALASIASCGDVGPFRANITPVDPHKPWKWSASGKQVRWVGSTLPERLSGVLEQRMMDAGRLNCTGNPLRAPLALHPSDIMLFAEGCVDETLLESLLFGCTWITWAKTKTTRCEFMHRWQKPTADTPMLRAWALLKLLFWSGAVSVRGSVQEVAIRPEPAILPLLRAKRMSEACRIAQRRLFSSGFAPLNVNYDAPGQEVRIAAALLFPCAALGMITSKVLSLSE